MGVVLNKNTGRADAAQTAIMKVMRRPVFIDNAIIHARYETLTGSNRSKVTNPTKNDFQLSHDRKYQLVEEEAAVRLVHNQRPGHLYQGAIYFDGSQLTSTATLPTLIYGASGLPANHRERLIAERIEDVSIGSRLLLHNMSGKELLDLGFTQGEVRLGQKLDVGLRTTDLAQTLAKKLDNTFTSISFGNPHAPNRSYVQRTHHSQQFLSQDFRNVNMLTALRFIGRHDGRVVLFDRFGNLLFVPFNFTPGHRTLNPALRFGPHKADPINSTYNRITVVGEQRALNHAVNVTLDDRSQQRGERDVNDIQIREMPNPIVDVSVTTFTGARRLARQVLRAQSLAAGMETSEGHQSAWDIRAGDVVIYGNQPMVAIRSTHKLATNESDFNFISRGAGLQAYLQSAEAGTIAVGEGGLPEKHTAIVKEDISFFLPFDIISTLFMRERRIRTTGLLLGDSARATIGRKIEPIGTSKSRRTLERGEGY